MIHSFGLILLTFIAALALSLFAWPTFAEGPLLYILYHLILVGLTIFPVYFLSNMVPWVVSFIPANYRARLAVIIVSLYFITALILLRIYRFAIIFHLSAAALFIASLLFFMKTALKLPIKRSEKALRLLSQTVFLPQLTIYLALIVKALMGKF